MSVGKLLQFNHFFCFILRWNVNYSDSAGDFDMMGICLRNCAQCKKMYGSYFEGQMCADGCVKFKGKVIPGTSLIDLISSKITSSFCTNCVIQLWKNLSKKEREKSGYTIFLRFPLQIVKILVRSHHSSTNFKHEVLRMGWNPATWYVYVWFLFKTQRTFIYF